MSLITDGLMIATALTACVYCLVLSRRLRRLTDSELGIGQQIAALNAALADTQSALAETRAGLEDQKSSAKAATERLGREVWLAKQTIGELEEAGRAAAETLNRALEAAPRPEPYDPDADPFGEFGTEDRAPLSSAAPPPAPDCLHAERVAL